MQHLTRQVFSLFLLFALNNMSYADFQVDECPSVSALSGMTVVGLEEEPETIAAYGFVVVQKNQFWPAEVSFQKNVLPSNYTINDLRSLIKKLHLENKIPLVSEAEDEDEYERSYECKYVGSGIFGTVSFRVDLDSEFSW